ncbi:hypothetical protein AAVH_40851, partial [Aphelenchoides avenae]
FGLDQCSQCMKDTGMGGSGTVDCYACCCDREPRKPLPDKYGPWTDLKPLCSERERVDCAEYFQGPNGERMVHRCLELGPLGHCKKWTSGCTMDGRCPWIDGGERPIGMSPLPVTDIKNGPWANMTPRCRFPSPLWDYEGCHHYELRGDGPDKDYHVRRCLVSTRDQTCTKWTEWCRVRGPCPWAYAERYGEESTH